MGNCIICGTPVDGAVCETHQEDVVFRFDGTSPSQLTPGRYYEGSVDGYADFGVFVDIGDRVTGLLHRSELDRRLESLDWEPGDTVYVQVLDVRDNGNVDLGWSIRQRRREFRGVLVDDPDGDYVLGEGDDETDADEPSADAGEPSPETTSSGGSGEGGAQSASQGGAQSASQGGATAAGGETAATPQYAETTADDDALSRATVDAIDDQVGSLVRLEGEIVSVRQTSGPTVFELRDETATVECAAFEEAGVRAYPDVDVDDVVRLEGEVERHHGDLQIETEALTVLEDDDQETVTTRLSDAFEQEARPQSVDLLAADDAVETVREELLDAATAIRRAVMEARPIVVRHSATVDGYVAGSALERAVLPLVREKHTRDDAQYHYFERRPLEGAVYDMDAATGDVTTMLQARDRHGEQVPLVVLADTGATAESTDGYELLECYGAQRLVIDDSRGDETVAESVSVAVSPSIAAGEDATDLTSSVLAANVAAAVNESVRDDLRHLPAISYWETTPDVYTDLAAEAGYDDTAVSERREAVALEAHYQSYSDKRELVIDLLFDGAGGLAAHISEQFRDKLETELATARENLTVRGVDGVTISVLDTDAYTHRYDFPPTDLLLDALHRAERGRTDGPAVTLGLDDDELRVRATETVDVRDLGAAIADAVPAGGVYVVGGRDGTVSFLPGERDAVLEAAVDALGETLG